jgi:minor extracellular serine protease Vpr
MACPHITGIMALIRMARGGGRVLDTATLRALIMNNAKPFKIYENDYIDSVARQGAGLVDITQAIKTQLLIEPQSLPLGDQNHLASNNEYKLMLENLGGEAAEFQLSHLVAASVQAYGRSNFSHESLPLTKPEYIYDSESEATVKFETSTVMVPAKSKLEVKVQIHPPVSASSPSIYSGYVVIQDSRNGFESHVPYAGFTGSLSDIHVLMKNSTSPMIELSEGFVSTTKPAMLHFQLASASAIVVIDVVSSTNTTQSLGMIPGGYEQFLGRNDVYDPKDLLGIEWYGTIAESPEAAVSRNKLAPSLFALETLPTSIDKPMPLIDMAGTKPLPNGQYHIRVSALRTYGNSRNPQDFDVWLSQVLEVRN